MSETLPIPLDDTNRATEASTVVKAEGYLNYIGETRVYFLIPNLGWSLFFNISDQSLKQQVITAFASPTVFEVYVFYTGSTVNAVQVRTI